MKQKLQIGVAALLLFITIIPSLKAQDRDWRLAANFTHTIGSNAIGVEKSDESMSKSWGLELGVQYRKYFHRSLYLQPGVYLNYQRRRGYSELWFGTPGPGIETQGVDMNLHGYSLGMGIDAMFGVSGRTLSNTVFKHFEIFTGPDFRYDFVIHRSTHPFRYTPNISDYNRLNFAWRIGLGVTFGRVAVNVSYALTATDVYKSTEYDDYRGLRSLDVIRGGISYSF